MLPHPLTAGSRRLVQPLAGREPSRALGAEFPHGLRLILCHLRWGEGLRPAAIHSLMNEDLGPGVPEGAPQGHTLGGVLLHPLERTIFQNRVPARFVDGNVEERRDVAHLSRHIALQVREVHEQDIRQVANLPPGADVLPERPEGIAVALQPLVPVLSDIAGGGSMGGPMRPGVSLSAAYHFWFAFIW